MDNETKTASEIWDIMEELGIAVDKSFFEPCDLTPPTLEELCRMFGVNSLAYIIHSGFISGYQNRYGDNLKPPTNVYHRMTA